MDVKGEETTLLSAFARPPTSFTAFLVVNVAKVTSAKWSDGYLADMLNTFVPLGTMASLLCDILRLQTTLFST